MMDKSELLFQMMEQPEKYSEEQWREILADEECRELYTMSSMVRSAVDDERVGKTLTDAQLDEVARRLAREIKIEEEKEESEETTRYGRDITNKTLELEEI